MSTVLPAGPLPPCPHGSTHHHGPATMGHVDPCPTRVLAAYGVADMNTVRASIGWTPDPSKRAAEDDACRMLWNVAYGRWPNASGPWLSEAHKAAHDGRVSCPVGPACPAVA